MLIELGKRAKKAESVLMTASTEKKNSALFSIAQALKENAGAILEANAIDIENAKKAGMKSALIDRLSLDEKRVFSVASGVKEVALLDDPVGKILSGTVRPNGLVIEKVSVPLGVIAVIFEARPNVTADAAALCLKSGNSVILRGGKEAFHSN